MPRDKRLGSHAWASEKWSHASSGGSNGGSLSRLPPRRSRSPKNVQEAMILSCLLVHGAPHPLLPSDCVHFECAASAVRRIWTVAQLALSRVHARALSICNTWRCISMPRMIAGSKSEVSRSTWPRLRRCLDGIVLRTRSNVRHRYRHWVAVSLVVSGFIQI